jgi:hypothetical protein
MSPVRALNTIRKQVTDSICHLCGFDNLLSLGRL